MKYHLSLYERGHSFNHLNAVVIGIASLLLMSSCEKIDQMVDRLRDVGKDAYSTVDSMNQEQAQALIGSESKLVMVEFYTDT